MDKLICTVDVVLLTLAEDGLQVALLKREHEPFKGVPALPGGYIQPERDQDARDAAQRVLKEKAGIEAPYLEQLATFSGPARDPRGWSISIAYYALVAIDVIAAGLADSQLRLANVDRAPSLPFDHRQILDTAVARLRSKSQYSSLPCYLAGDTFTLPQLQRVYETLLGEPVNKVSFRRRMMEMNLLEAVEGKLEAGGAHRPAQLYRLQPALRRKLHLFDRAF